MAQLTVKQLIDMEFALQQMVNQAEKLPINYEWELRVFLYKTMPYMGAYKGMATRLLEKRYGIKRTQERPAVKGKKQNPIVWYDLNPEMKEDYEKDMAPLDKLVVPEEIPQFDQKLLIMSNVSIDYETLKPLIIFSDAQANHN